MRTTSTGCVLLNRCSTSSSSHPTGSKPRFLKAPRTTCSGKRSTARSGCRAEASTEGNGIMTTFIKTGDCSRVKTPGNQGEVSEILNHALCGAKNVLGMLRWLSPGQQFHAEARQDTHQLVYLMEGE